MSAQDDFSDITSQLSSGSDNEFMDDEDQVFEEFDRELLEAMGYTVEQHQFLDYTYEEKGFLASE